MQKECDAVFYKCGHNICCMECSNKIRRDNCPVCNKKITDVMKIFN